MTNKLADDKKISKKEKDERKKEEFTTAQDVKEEENEIFDDFFDQQNDFFAASSTISPVVFKGSPGPGFFSSPRPYYDNDGRQVSFTSPNPFGGPGDRSGGRPSFNNIGAHIDLGPQKPQIPLDQSFFNPSSTVSNKIFIGSLDETTTPLTTEPSSPSTTTGTVEEIKTEAPTVVTPKRNFPSFPIRGGGDSLSFKPKLDFSRKTKSSFKFGRQPAEAQDHDGDEKEEKVTEQSDIASTVQSTTTTSKPETSSKRFFVDLTGGKVPRVKSNLLFNKRKRPNKERFRLKLEKLQQKAATESSSSTSPSTSSTSPSTSTAESVTEDQTPASQFKLKSKYKPSNRI